MNLVDSSGWLEYFSDGKNAKHFAIVILDTKNLIVSTINIYEVFKKVYSFKDELAALQAVSVMQQAKVIDLTPQIAIEAAKISSDNSLPMADSIILATARLYNATIWTQDVDFKKFDGVKYFSK